LQERKERRSFSTDSVRSPSVDIAKVRNLKKGSGASEIAKALKIGRASRYYLRREAVGAKSCLAGLNPRSASGGGKLSLIENTLKQGRGAF